MVESLAAINNHMLMANQNRQRSESEMVCPSCGYKAQNADDMQAHMREMQDDQAHTVRARSDERGMDIE